MWNLGELGARFRVAAPNHPETLLEEPQVFQAVGGKMSCMPGPRQTEIQQMHLHWVSDKTRAMNTGSIRTPLL